MSHVINDAQEKSIRRLLESVDSRNHEVTDCNRVGKALTSNTYTAVSANRAGAITVALIFCSAIQFCTAVYADSATQVRKDNWLQQQVRVFRSYPHLDSAYRLMNSGHLAEAKNELKRFMAIDPYDTGAKMTYLVICYRLQHYQEVIDYAGSLVNSSEHQIKAQLYRGFSYQFLGQPDNAIADFEAVAANPGADETDLQLALNAIVDLEISRQNHTTALSALRRLAYIKNDFSQYYRQGVVFEKLGQLDEAEAAYLAAHILVDSSKNRTAVQLNLKELTKKRINVLLAQGEKAKKRGDWSGAVRYFNQGLDLNPHNTTIMRNIAEAFYNNGSYSDAVRWVRKLNARQPNVHDQEFIASMLYMAKQYPESAKEYSDLIPNLKNNSDRYRIYMTLGNLYLESDDLVNAGRSFNAAAAANETVEALVAQAEIQLSLKNWHNALDIYKKLLNNNNLTSAQRIDIFQRQGHLYSRVGEYQLAATSFQQAINSEDSSGENLYALGITYYQMHEWEQAIAQFQRALEWKISTYTLLYLGYSYKQLGKSGMAVHYFLQALPEVDDLKVPEQKALYDELGHLYADMAEYSRAAHMWSHSLTIINDPEIVIRLGRMQRLMGEVDTALMTMTTLDATALSPTSMANLFDELAHLYTKKERDNDAIDALIQANALDSNAYRKYRLGSELKATGRLLEATPYLESAIALAPDNTGYSVALGYTYMALNRFDEAAQLFERVVEHEPDHQDLYEALGYLHMRMLENRQAEDWFMKAIDYRLVTMAPSSQTQERASHDIQRMREEMVKMTNVFDLTIYQTYRSNENKGSSSSATLGGGVTPSQGGIELSYRPPRIGFRDERIFEIFSRMMWDTQRQSLAIKHDSLQAGIGVRYKPIRSHNLYFSAERLVAIGNNTTDDWLLRGVYSWLKRYEHNSTKHRWSYTSLYGDTGYFIENPSAWGFYWEARQGLSFKQIDNLLWSPYMVLDGRQNRPDPQDTSYIEGGAGLSVKYLFGETRYVADNASIETQLQYKTAIKTSSSGWSLSTALRF